MIVVDSSVWIANLRGTDSAAVATLRRLIAEDDDRILIGDLVLLEVLQGARDARHANRIEHAMRAFQMIPMLDIALAVQAAENYRRLRAMGFTVRKIADTIIGTFCIEKGHRLLHDDRDFGPMVEHLGLLEA